MKKTMILAGLVATVSLNAAVIEQVIVRQQWPWSTDVKVEYKISGVTAPVNIGVRAFNGNEELPASNLEASISGERYGISKDGVGSFVIDPVKAFGTASVAIANFKVKLSVSDAAANINEVIYKVFNLSTGEYQDLSRADFYNGKVEEGEFVTDYTAVDSGFSTSLDDVFIWTGVTNNVKYRTTHLVLRKIPSANVTWTMGAPASEVGNRFRDAETNHLVRFTSDYFIGVFEVTQKQYFLVRGSNTAKHSSIQERMTREDADVLPESYMNGGEAAAFASGLATKTGLSFSLPTDAQWEFACRAGTATGLYVGREVASGAYWSGSDSNLNKISWYGGADGGNSKINGTPTVRAVGRKCPNAFGLYDMLGNVYEYCKDWYSAGDRYIESFGAGWNPETVVENPTGPATKATVGSVSDPMVIRGGSYNKTGIYIRSAHRSYATQWYTANAEIGMRVALTVAE